jgi:DAACS family dicarboxylate/amino acid:cation (Na+ or H+) symporter
MTKLKNSLPLQIVLAVVLGIALGALFPHGELKPLSEVGKAVIHWVKLIAGPFLFLTIVASIVEVELKPGDGLRLVAIALLNTAIAIAFGMVLAQFFLGDLRIEGLAANLAAVKPPDINLGFSGWIKTMMPASLFAPFVQNDILLIALLALLMGIALRKAYAAGGPAKYRELAAMFEGARAVPAIFLAWLIHIIPLAVLTVVAGAVSEYGFGIFRSLLQYVAVVLIGFVLQTTIVYGIWIFGIAKMKAKVFFRAAKEPVWYAFGVNSSLATLPLTLKALKEMGVSDRSSSLGAGVATNLNNDGIVLYEAMAVFFIAQVSGIHMSEAQWIAAALSCIVASMGITGIPEAGFISLSVVVGTLGLPAEMLPLLLAVDWMLARGRSVVNVLSDMTLSIAMDATERKHG